MIQIAIRREDVYKLIDKVPDEKLSDLVKLIKLLAVPEEDPTEDEIRGIKKATNDFKNSETLSYTIDELHKKFLGNE
jgi:hypothetical protein